MVNGLQIVQKGEGAKPNLMLWVMGDLQTELRLGAPHDTIAYLYLGAGTSKYEAPPSIASIEAAAGGSFARRTWGAWSAGGRAVDRWLDNWQPCMAPDAILLADAVYAPFKADGKTPDLSRKEGLIRYAKAAASGSLDGPILVLWHSDIPTPGYASSGACIAEIRRLVEEYLGFTMPALDTKRLSPMLDGRNIKEAFAFGNLLIMGYAGKDKAEHIAEAKMIDEAMKAACPWFTDKNTVFQQQSELAVTEHHTDPVLEPVEPAVYVPEANSVLTVCDGKLVSPFGALVVAKAEVDLAAGLKEYDARVVAMLKNVGAAPPANWCAAAFWTWWLEAGGFGYTPSAGAKATMALFQKANRWIAKSDVRGCVQPGMVPIWDRSQPGRPETSWWGHIGILSKVIDSVSFYSIEGNHNDTVSCVMHKIDEPKLLGFGVL